MMMYPRAPPQQQMPIAQPTRPGQDEAKADQGRRVHGSASETYGGGGSANQIMAGAPHQGGPTPAYLGAPPPQASLASAPPGGAFYATPTLAPATNDLHMAAALASYAASASAAGAPPVMGAPVSAVGMMQHLPPMPRPPPSTFTPVMAAAMAAPSRDFVMPGPTGLDSGHRDLTILSVKFRNLGTGEVFFEAPAPTDKSQPESPVAAVTLSSMPRNQLFSYEFGLSFFRLESFGISLTLQSGPSELSNVTLVENYFFRDAKIKTYQFTYGRVLPNAILSWDLVYDVPPMVRQIGDLVTQNPDERIIADTFLFNDEHLVLHNKVLLCFKP